MHGCRFFRLRCEKLERFEDLVTVDMHAHFKALSEAQSLGGHAAALSDRHGAPLLRPSAFNNANLRDGAAGKWAGGNGERVFTPGFYAVDETGSVDGSLDEDGGGKGGGYHHDMLEQHRGVYARLGTYSRLKGSRAEQWLQGVGAFESESEAGGGKPGKQQTRPMELQVQPLVLRYLRSSRLIPQFGCVGGLIMYGSDHA